MGKGARIRRERREGARESPERRAARHMLRMNLQACEDQGIFCAEQIRAYENSFESTRARSDEIPMLLARIDGVWTLMEHTLSAAFAENENRTYAEEWGIAI